MALSKPRDFLLELVGAYFSKLYTSPIRTTAFTSCICAVIGNIISQKMIGMKSLNFDSLSAFALFGLIYGGPIPYYFNKNVYHLTKHPLAILLIERLLFTPCFQAFYLYMIPFFEGKTHEESIKQMKLLYPDIVIKNLKYMSLMHYINFTFIPPMMRVLFSNFINLLWTIHLTKIHMKLNKDKSKTN